MNNVFVLLCYKTYIGLTLMEITLLLYWNSIHWRLAPVHKNNLWVFGTKYLRVLMYENYIHSIFIFYRAVSYHKISKYAVNVISYLPSIEINYFSFFTICPTFLNILYTGRNFCIMLSCAKVIAPWVFGIRLNKEWNDNTSRRWRKRKARNLKENNEWICGESQFFYRIRSRWSL